jgi:hypothetical protein
VGGGTITMIGIGIAEGGAAGGAGMMIAGIK